MKNTRQWFLHVPWGKLALVSYGHPDGEPVFLVHGRQDSCSVFEPLIDQMSGEYYYVALDMPGNGLSDAFPHVSNVPLRCGDLSYAVVFNSPPKPQRPFIEFNKFSQALHYKAKNPGAGGPKLMRFHFLYAMELALLHLGWDKFIFMGHSMGCEQGLFYNVIYPGQITKMILLDAGPTLMRMQIEDAYEYQRSYYDSYYENYHRENFVRKTYTRPSAIQALKRLRDLNDEQCSHLLQRNFHGLDNWHPIEVWHPNEKCIREIAKKIQSPKSPIDNDIASITSITISNLEIPHIVQLPHVGRSPTEVTPEIVSPNDGSSNTESSNSIPSHYVSPNQMPSAFVECSNDDNGSNEMSLDDDTATGGRYKFNVAINSIQTSLNEDECLLPGRSNEGLSPIQASSSAELSANERNSNEHRPAQVRDEATSITPSSSTPEHGQSSPFACCVQNPKPTQNPNQTQNANLTQNENDTQNSNETQESNERPQNGLSSIIQRMREIDEVGYLSWDNRLKNLAPQNYGNEYYFQLFKTIPPTLLIAASDGAKNIPPIPKWHLGAKELLDKMATLDNFHRVDVEGSHDVHYTHPERVAPHIIKFLKQRAKSKL